MKIDEAKREELETVLGPDEASAILDQLGEGAKALQDNVRWKAVEAETPPAADDSALEPDAEDEEGMEPAAGEDQEAAKATETPAPEAAPTPVAVVTPESIEIVLPEAMLDDVVAKAKSELSGELAPIVQALEALAGAVAEQAKEIKTLQASEDVRIAEKVANLPRGDVRRYQAQAVVRPTQKAREAAKEEDPPAGDFLNKGLTSLYGGK